MKFLFVDLWPWWLGGIIIGLLVPLMYYFLNTALGVSTGYGNFLKIIHPSTKLKWLNSEKYKDRFNWLFIFMIGMIIGGFLSARVSGMPILESGMGLFTETLGWSYVFFIFWFFIGGALLGLALALQTAARLDTVFMELPPAKNQVLWQRYFFSLLVPSLHFP